MAKGDREAKFLSSSGTLTVRRDNGQNPDGSPAVDLWCVNTENIAQHRAQFSAEIASLSAGDRSALADAENEAKTRVDKR